MWAGSGAGAGCGCESECGSGGGIGGVGQQGGNGSWSGSGNVSELGRQFVWQQGGGGEGCWWFIPKGGPGGLIWVRLGCGIAKVARVWYWRRGFATLCQERDRFCGSGGF